MSGEDTAQVAEHVEAPVVQGRNFEQEARAAGWVPEAEFKGEKRPAVFVDAETFVKRGEELLPFIRKENKELKQELSETKADFAKRLAAIESVNKRTFEAQQRHHEAEIARVKREQRAAVASGDEAEFDRLEKVKDGLEKAAPKPEEVKPVDPIAERDAKQAKWRAENPWFDSDFDIQDWAIRYSNWYGEKHPNLSFEDNMRVVEAEARKRYPEKFGGKTAANGHAAVDGGGDFSGFGGKADPLAKIPAEARAQAKKDMAAFPKIYPTAEAWVKAYNS